MCVCLSICTCRHTFAHTPFSPYTTPPPVLVSISLWMPWECLCELLGSCCGWVLRGALVLCLCVCLSVYLYLSSHTHTYTIQPIHHAIACPCQHFFVDALGVSLRAPGLVLWLGVAGCTSVVSVCVFVCLSVSLSWECLCELRLVLWLGVAGCTSVVSVCVFVCLSVHTYTIQPIHHAIACPCQHFFVDALGVSLRAPGLVLWLGVAGCTSVVSVCVFVCLSVLVFTHSHIHHSAHTPRHRLSLSAFLCGCLGSVFASSWARAVAGCCGVH